MLKKIYKITITIFIVSCIFILFSILGMYLSNSWNNEHWGFDILFYLYLFFVALSVLLGLFLLMKQNRKDRLLKLYKKSLLYFLIFPVSLYVASVFLFLLGSKYFGWD